MERPRFVPAERMLAAGGVLGPAAFVAGWTAGAALHPGPYSSVEDAISRLAAPGSPVRPLMTAGFVVFGVGVAAFAVPVRRWVPGPAWTAVATTGLATLGVAATPVDTGVDTAHAAFAGIGYASLAAAPLLASVSMGRAGRPGWARASAAVGAVSAAALAATAVGPVHGLLQRVGLTAGHAWLAALATGMLRRGRAPRHADG